MILTHFSLFSGIGGLDLAAEWAGFKTVGQCEFADYPTKILEKHWPDVPRWRDIRDVTTENFRERTGLRTINIISGGFPCQPFSIAGKRKGKDDDRYLWPEMLRIIKELRPTWVIGENVAGFITMGLDNALSDLAAESYEARAFVLPACAVNAPHRRDRVFIVARDADIKNEQAEQKICGGVHPEPAEICKNVANPNGDGRNQEFSGQAEKRRNADPLNIVIPKSGDVIHANAIMGSAWSGIYGKHKRQIQRRYKNGGRTPEHGGGEWWEIEPDVGRMVDGFPFRVDRLKCLGNAVVPYQAFPIFQAIYEIEKGLKDDD